MKKLIYILVCLCVVAMTAGCSEDIITTFGSIYGTITDRMTNQPVSGATVVLSPGNFSSTTGSNGHYEFIDLDPGQYKVQVSANGYESNSSQVTVVAGNRSIQDIAISEIKKESVLELTASTLTFNGLTSSLSFTIQNKGNEKFNWTITGMTGKSWLSVDPTNGTLQGGKKAVVVVEINQNNLTKDEDATLIVSTEDESASIKIIAKYESRTSDIQASVSTLDFGSEKSQMSFTLTNIGNVESKAISITPESGATWLSVDPTFITSLAKSASKTVYVTVNRSMITEAKTAVIHITHEENTTDVTVHATPVSNPVLSVDKTSLDFRASATSETIQLMSFYAPSTYSVKIEEGASWLQVSPDHGYLKTYNSSDNSTVESLQIGVSRSDMGVGRYGGKIIISESTGSSVSITVSMEVKEQDIVVTNGLKAYYLFENNFNDYTENENDGFGLNSPQFVTGVGNNSTGVKFSASSCMKVGTSGLIDTKNQTTSFWIKNPGDGTVFLAYCSEYESNSPSGCLEMENGQFRYTVSPYYNWYLYYRNQHSIGCFSHPTINDDNWHHIVIASDYGTTKYGYVTSALYIDGKKTSTTQESFSNGSVFYGKCHTFQLGGNVNHYGTIVDGSSMTIDNFRVYARCLSDDEIKTIFNAKQ